MDKDIKCKRLEAIYRLENGLLRSASEFSFIERDAGIKIIITEYGIRKISLESEGYIKVFDLYSVLLSLERLLQVFDGVFIPLEKIEIIGDESREHYNSVAVHLKKQRLNYFASSNLFSIDSDRIINFEMVLTSDVFQNWEKILDEMGVVNQMYLYAVSDCGFTNDVKCAFLIELSESLVEIVDIPKQKEDRDERTLKECLKAVIKNYGGDIFEKEIKNLDRLLQYMVNLRVNIMHIKTKYRTPYLNGKEATFYMIKLSYLYRVIILNQLGISELLYRERLLHNIHLINNWGDILDSFLAKMDLS